MFKNKYEEGNIYCFTIHFFRTQIKNDKKGEMNFWTTYKFGKFRQCEEKVDLKNVASSDLM